MQPAIYTLKIVPGRYAVLKYAPDSSWPVVSGAFLKHFFSLTKTDDEISLVCHEDFVEACHGAMAGDAESCETGWALLKVEGPLDFGLTGVLASLSGILASAGVSIFAVSTYDTDYIMLKEHALQDATQALRGAGHTVIE